MKIIENEIHIKYDAEQKAIETYRLFEDTTNMTVITSYPLDKLKNMGFEKAGRLIGEDILLLLSATRDRFMETGANE